MNVTADRIAAPALACLLGGAGAIHMLRPRVFEPLIPPQLTGVASRRDWVYASGAGELACAAAVAAPRTRRIGGYATAALLVGVFPGNIQMALDYRRRNRPAWQQAVAYGRLPLQVPLVLWALRAARG
ncbi:hypothetical protein [Tomitella fengzijianii]|uniref:DoxX-like family protein n=1 Tax=Tomitella fengzijianii TaxID=2597660 RepID=A0A516X102_9ACTN|nr:hypothetical protein [Tomitella fengzijianii]QDQ96710.1 hypothetical protein FO059_04335 [Tomitella fengzijianii]